MTIVVWGEAFGDDLCERRIRAGERPAGHSTKGALIKGLH
jgi:hypothetical protein